MIKLKEILSEKKTELKDYPKDIQKKYNEYLKTWGKEFADRYLEREDDPNDKIIIDRFLTEPKLNKQPDLHIHIVIPNEFQNAE